MTEAMIEVKGVSKGFDQKRPKERVLDDISFTIARAEFVALTGDSGCGKTTLLNLIGGLDQPDEGVVLVNGTSMAELSPARRARFLNGNVGFVFQLHHLLPDQTAIQNVMLPMRIGGWRRRKAQQRAKDLLESLELGHRLDYLPPNMSGGEQQRVAIARALANNPKVLLVDEPTGSLHPKFKEEVFQSLLALSRKEGVTVAMVTHDIKLVRDDEGRLRVDREIKVGELGRPEANQGVSTGVI